MTLSTTPVVLTTASSSFTLTSGNTLQTTGIAVTNAYNAALSPQVVNSGTIKETGINNSANDIAIFLNAGTAGTTSILNNSTGLISGAAYGVVIGGGNSSTLNNRATITNFGTIKQSGDTGNSDSAIKFSTGTGGAVVNSGLLSGLYGGVYFKTGDSASLTVINNVGGTITNSGGGRAVTFNDINGASGIVAGSSATFINAGIVNGLVEFDVANGGATATNAGTITGQIKSSSGGGTLTVDAGSKITGGAAFGSGATLDFGAGTVAVGTINTGNYTGFNSATILSGADFNIGSTASAVSIAGVTSIGDFGTLNIAGSIAGTSINMEGTIAGSHGVVDFTGTNTATPIYDYANNDQVVIGTMALPAPAAGSSFQDSYNTATGVLTTNEINASGATIGTTNITLTGAPGTTYSSSSFDIVSGPGGETIVLGSSQIANSGSIYLDYGETATLSNTALDNVNVTFGTHGSLTGPNVLVLNGANQDVANLGQTFSSNIGTISGFGLNDIITLGTSNIVGAQATDVYVTTYNSVTGVLSVKDESEYARYFAVNGLTDPSEEAAFTTVTFSANPGTLVETYGTNGINIETAATDAEQGYTFNTTGTANINTPLDYSGMVAPGDSIVSGEVVTIASGTATFTSVTVNPVGNEFDSSSLVNSGTILVSGTSSAFTDYATLTGGGTVVAANGGHININSATGTDAAQTLQFGTGGTSLALNTIDLNPTSGSFAGTISGFGLNDDIIIGPSVLPSVATGSSVKLSYAGSLLTVGEVNSAGTVTASTTINVGTGYSTSSFVALLGTNGINIETPATVDEAPLTFVGTAGTVTSFENPTKYVGGLAPGSTIVPGETVIVAAGTASITSTAPVTDNGTIIVSGAGTTLTDSSSLAGTGSVTVANGGTLSIPTSGTTESVNLAFGAPGTTLSPNVIDFTGTNVYGTPVGTVSNLGSLDNIVLATTELPDSGYYAPGGPGYNSAVGSGDFAAGQDSLSYNSATGQIVIFDAATSFLDHNVNYAGQYPDYAVTINSTPGLNPANFKLSSVAGEGFVVSYMPCFAAGTRILTTDGQVAVESIKVGDKVLTVRDGAEAEVVWVGQRTIDLARHAMPEKVRPVRILAGAFGEGLPERDLRLSPDHALFIDGHLIEAKTLVNGVTVIEEMATRFVTYHHVELANHDIMLAEGLAAESYLDSGNRVMFESDAAPIMLHPDFAAVSRAAACAPLATDGDVVVTARSRLIERAVALGFTATGDVDLTLRVAGSTVTPHSADADEELLFVLPSGAASVELISSVGVPAETSAAPGDRRSLGVAVTGLALIAGGKRHVIALDDPAHSGFYGMEDGHRWTKGAARIALPAYTGRAVLEVTINGQATRWRARNAA